jgi:hypothetical protein
MGQIGEKRVIVIANTKANKKSYITQDSSREWAIVISCILIVSLYLLLYVIFKGVKRKLKWLKHLV